MEYLLTNHKLLITPVVKLVDTLPLNGSLKRVGVRVPFGVQLNQNESFQYKIEKKIEKDVEVGYLLISTNSDDLSQFDWLTKQGFDVCITSAYYNNFKIRIDWSEKIM